MTSKTTLIEVKDRGWLNGFWPLWRKENHSLWGAWSWLMRILIWTVIIDGLVAVVAFSQTEGPSETTPLAIYFIIAAIIPACGVIIFRHETLIDERKMGTAAWVLSKPVSRAAFLLSKLLADSLDVLASMVLVQGIIAYLVYQIATGISLPIPGFLAGMGLIYLFLIFYLALTMMLGTLFHSRGPVIGISLVLVSSSYLAFIVPWLGKVMPSSLILSIDPGKLSLAEALATGQLVSSITPLLATVLWIILFIIVAIVRFGREEF